MSNPRDLSFRICILISALFLSSGFSLLVYVLAGVSFIGALGLTVAVLLTLTSYAWMRMRSVEKEQIGLYLRVGAISGVASTLAYDLSRFLLIKITGIRFWPFDIFAIFGKALVGERYRGIWVSLLGFSYHVTNGIGFSIAYVVWWGKRGIWAGIMWAMFLEALMVSIYPGWLHLQALEEFLSVSVFGHLIYGSVLGVISRHLISKQTATGRNS